MRITVAFEDAKINIDGYPKFEIVLPEADPNWRVIQWYGDYGWVEVKVGDRIWVSDPDILLPYIAAYNAV